MVWLLAAVYFLVKSTRYFFMSWSAYYTHDRLGSGAAVSSLLGSLFELAGIPAMLLGGYVSDRVFGARRMPVAVLTLLGAAVVLAGFNSLPATELALGLGFFGIGFLIHIPDSLVSGTAAVDFGTRKGASTAVGLINGFGSLGAVLGVTLPGWIRQVAGSDGDRWQVIFLGLGAALVLAAVLLAPQWHRLPGTGKPKNDTQTPVQVAQVRPEES
jgi:OPA family sugar phosphate sensor protein UhpC-like MFS transporter